MPANPGNQTILVVERNEDLTTFDRKGQPGIDTVITPLPGCHLAPESGEENVGAGTDYSRILWRIICPPLPAALRIKPNGLIWFDDDGALKGRTLRDTYNDPELGERDVASFNVENSWPHYVDGLPYQIAVVAKSEAG
jgi:hypothetical protein